MEVVPRIDLSTSVELRLPLRWIAILRPMLPDGLAGRHDRHRHRAGTWPRRSLVGADVAMMTSAVLREGPAARHPHHRRAPALARRARLRVGRPAAGLDELRRHRRPHRLRAGQLPPGAPLVVGPHAVADQPRAPAASRASSSGIAGGSGGGLRVGCVAAGEPAEPAQRHRRGCRRGRSRRPPRGRRWAGPRRRSRGCGRGARTVRRGRTR